MKRPRLLDLFCGAGGASMGYHRAGFNIVGVDFRPQKRYPFPFVRADALLPPFELGRFDAIHASPPCQAYSVATASRRAEGHEYPDLVGATRDLCFALVGPWVMENVPGAPIRPDLVVCGCQVGLREIRRIRWFETSWHALELASPHEHDRDVISVVGKGTVMSRHRRGFADGVDTCRRVMGIPWMTRRELSQAIPPAYTERVGRLLLDVVSEIAGLALH